ncbi:hypothetical protein Agub_g11118, partial [Astrephomene gubernaculifera]
HDQICYMSCSWPRLSPPAVVHTADCLRRRLLGSLGCPALRCALAGGAGAAAVQLLAAAAAAAAGVCGRGCPAAAAAAVAEAAGGPGLCNMRVTGQPLPLGAAPCLPPSSARP